MLRTFCSSSRIERSFENEVAEQLNLQILANFKSCTTKEIIDHDLIRFLNKISTLLGMPGRPVDINKLRQHVVSSRFLAKGQTISE